MIADIVATTVTEVIGTFILAAFAVPFVLLLVFACADFLLGFALSEAIERWLGRKVRR